MAPKQPIKQKEYQQFLLDFVLNPNVIQINVTQAAEVCGVSRDTIYNWINSPETEEALKGNLIKNRIERRKALHASSLTGNPQAIRLEEQVVEGWSEKLEQKITGEITVDADKVAKKVQEILNAKDKK